MPSRSGLPPFLSIDHLTKPFQLRAGLSVDNTVRTGIRNATPKLALSHPPVSGRHNECRNGFTALRVDPRAIQTVMRGDHPAALEHL